ncbi:MAG: tetratricopeptide repeat protein [Bacteroidetes bacterium]|nr:tetratricopeptide repeat protein [Bacteroidota bacterium]MCA6442790.1 tetratricopeptide repeat protein [Bacteroidota bacterium]
MKSNILPTYINKISGLIIKISLTFLLGLTSEVIISQNKILNVYSDLIKSANDSIKVRRYFSLADEYYEIKNYANSFKAIDTALSIAEYTKRKDLIALCYYKYGSNHSYLKDYVAGGKYYEKAAIIWQQQLNNKELARLYFNYGNNYYFLNDTKRAITYYKLVLNYVYKSKDSMLLADTYNNLGICYATGENY